MKIALPFCLACLVLAGCVGQNADEADRNDPADQNLQTVSMSVSSSSNVTRPISNDPRPETQDRVHIMEATNCHGFGGGHSFLGDTNPARPPPGWEQNIPFDGWGSDVVFEIMVCDRIAWGPFERPMTILIETHSNVQPPEACRKDSPSNRLFGLIRVWVDDAEVAVWANQTYGMPVAVLEWNQTFENGSLDSQVWTWSANGQPPTRAEFSTTAALGTASAQIPQRVAWTAGKHLWLLDIIREPTQFLGGQPDAYPIELHEPMFLASVDPVPPIVAGDYVFQTPMTYTFQEFGDYRCETPL